MKKALMLLTAICILCLFVGCSQGDETESGTEEVSVVSYSVAGGQLEFTQHKFIGHASTYFHDTAKEPLLFKDKEAFDKLVVDFDEDGLEDYIKGVPQEQFNDTALLMIRITLFSKDDYASIKEIAVVNGKLRVTLDCYYGKKEDEANYQYVLFAELKQADIEGVEEIETIYESNDM